MCLNITENFEEETEEFRNSSKILTGYKVLQKYGYQFYSLYQSFDYKIGENHISNRNSVNLTEKENMYLEIGKGFHFFTSSIDTKIELFRNSCDLYVIGKFEILPKNLVAVGTFMSFKNFVAIEAKLVEIVEEK